MSDIAPAGAAPAVGNDKADRVVGKDVKGPFTAYAQAEVIAKHAKEIGGGLARRPVV